MLKFIIILAFISCFLFLYAFLKYAIGRQKPIMRLQTYISPAEGKEERKNTRKNDFRAGLDIIAKGIGNAKFLDGYKRSVQLKLNRASVPLKAEEFISISLIVFIGCALLGMAATRIPLVAVLFGLIGWIIPGIILKSVIKKRIRTLNDQLADAIVLISNSLKAGYSFFQAVDIVSKDMTGPIAVEFGLLQKEMNLGLPTEKALENLIKRVSSDDLELIITAVLIQRQVGGNLAEVLDNISTTIRDRVKIKGEVKTVTAQGRISGLIISLLPPVLGFLIYLINPSHMSLLFKSTLGLCIVGFSVIMELIGIYFIGKIVKIEV